jgi:hypothetical protein
VSNALVNAAPPDEMCEPAVTTKTDNWRILCQDLLDLETEEYEEVAGNE